MSCRCSFNIWSRPLKSGISIAICRSNRPGLSSALSKISGLFVAPSTPTPEFDLNQSISTSYWLRVFSLVEKPRRAAPTASISPMKIILGAHCLESANKLLTLEGPTPTNNSLKFDPQIDKNGTSDSPATAFAKSVFPVPEVLQEEHLGKVSPSILHIFLGSWKVHKLLNFLLYFITSSHIFKVHLKHSALVKQTNT